MSNKETITIENATIETLGAVKYGELLETFTSLGVPECWVPGTKAVKMVQNAIEKLAVIKSMKAEGKTDDEIKESFDKKEDDKAKEKLKETEKNAEDKAKSIQAEATIKEDVKNKLSKEQIIKNIESCDANLLNGIPAQRTVLLSKKVQLEKMLESYDED